MVVCAYNPNICEVEIRGELVQDRPRKMSNALKLKLQVMMSFLIWMLQPNPGPLQPGVLNHRAIFPAPACMYSLTRK